MKTKLFLSLSEYGNLMNSFDAQKVGYINDGQFIGTEPYTFDETFLDKKKREFTRNLTELQKITGFLMTMSYL